MGRKKNRDCDFVQVTVNDRNCTAEVEEVGTLTVKGYDRDGRRSGCVYLNGKQICDGFSRTGNTMFYDHFEPFSKFVKKQMELWKRDDEDLKYRILVTDSLFNDLCAATKSEDFDRVAYLVESGARDSDNKIRNSLPPEQRSKFDEAVQRGLNKDKDLER